MTIKYRKYLGLAGALALTSMMIAPSYAEDTTTVITPTAALPITGTIHIIDKVINDNMGTKTPADFTFTLKHHGVNVAGSPFVGAGNAGTTFVVPPGTYVVTAEPVDGYSGYWMDNEKTPGYIVLLANQTETMTRYSEDHGQMEVAVGTTQTTQNGGTLPNTATPLYDYLVAGSLFAAAGALGLRKSYTLGKTK